LSRCRRNARRGTGRGRLGVAPEGRGQVHGVFQGSRALHLDVDAESAAELSGEEGHLLRFGDVVATRQESQELVLEVLDGAGAMELRQFA